MKPELLIKKYDREFYASIERYLINHDYYQVAFGSYRKTFADVIAPQRTVIKLPREQDGFEHNIREAYAYRKYRNQADRCGIIYAPCRLLPNGCLLMSFVSHVAYDQLPIWAKYIDGGQAGMFRDRFVAYDSGCDVSDEDRVESLNWAGVSGR